MASFSKMKQSNSSSTFEKPPLLEAGSYAGRIARITTLGLHKATEYQSSEIKLNKYGKPVLQEKAYIEFELDEQFVDIGGKQMPRWVGKEYTISFHEKAAFAALVEALKVDSYKEMIGLPVNIGVGLTGTGKSNKVNSISLLSGKAAAVVSELVDADVCTVFEFDDPDATTALNVPKWLRDKIKEAENYDGSKCARILEAIPDDAKTKSATKASKATVDDDFDDEVPF